MTKLRAAVLVGFMALTGACGGSSSSGGHGGSGGSDGGGGSGGSDGSTDTVAAINVMVSGVASPHPLTLMLDPTASFSMLQVSVVDPLIELGGGQPLATGALDTSAQNCGEVADGGAGDAAVSDAAATDGGSSSAGPVCGWSFPSVNIAGISLGLVGKLEDQRAAADQVWVKTGTGAGTAAFINMEKSTKAPITMRQLFAVSKNTQTALAALVSEVLTATDAGAPVTGAEMQARGYLIGHVVGKLSQGAPPVAGATISLPTGAPAASQLNIIYPNATFTGAQTSTAPHGIVLVVPKPMTTPMAIVAAWNVTPPTGSTLTWQTYTAGSQPGAAFVLLFLADEGD